MVFVRGLFIFLQFWFIVSLPVVATHYWWTFVFEVSSVGSFCVLVSGVLGSYFYV